MSIDIRIFKEWVEEEMPFYVVRTFNPNAKIHPKMIEIMDRISNLYEAMNKYLLQKRLKEEGKTDEKT